MSNLLFLVEKEGHEAASSPQLLWRSGFAELLHLLCESKPFYMSPEQATGDQPVGASTDTYALGSVLYEMLVGDPPFPGSTAQAVLGKIIAGKPVSVTEQRPLIPANVDAAVRCALEKLPADRFNAAEGFARALADRGFRHGGTLGPGAVSSGSTWNRVSITATALAVAFAGLSMWALLTPEPAPDQSVARFESFFRADQAPNRFGTNSFNLSPDGSVLIYRGPSEQAPFQLWMRRWDDLDATPVRGTDGGGQPAVSHDSRQLAFLQGGEIKVLSFEGGPIETLGQGVAPRWGADGSLYFRGPDGTVRVPATGGAPEPVTRLAEGEESHFIGDVLPGGEGALMRVGFADGETEIRALRFETGETTTLTSGAWPRYAASGHLVFLTTLSGGGTLMAAPFDPETMALTGPAVSVLDDVIQYALSETGDIVYLTVGGDPGVDTELVWVTRSGDATPIDRDWRFDRGDNTYYGWRLSPDGARVAFGARTDGNDDIWIKELPTGLSRRLTFDEGVQLAPWWSPDGRSVFYLSGPTPARHVWSRNADGTGQPGPLLEEGTYSRGLWSRDAEWLVLRTMSVGQTPGPRDVVALRPATDSTPIPLLTSAEYGEQMPALSPDGRWLAYASDETGSFQVTVRPFPDVDAGRWQISTGSGIAPMWAHSGQELFYIAGRVMVAATIDTEAGFQVVGQEELFTIPPEFFTGPYQNFYDIAPDDQRFLMGRRYAGEGDDGGTPSFVLVQNFFEELKARVPN